MINKLNISLKKNSKKVKMRTRLLIPILLVVIFQLLTFVTALIFGGEFTNIREYAYNTLVEKTENRRAYIQNELQEKPDVVLEYSEQVNGVVSEILHERGENIADLKTDKELSRNIIESSMGCALELLRRSMSNDVYLILDTGDLYADEGGANAKPALYLRNQDIKSDSGYQNLQMAVGSTSIAKEYNIARHAGWSAYFMPNEKDSANFDFYYKTIQVARENKQLPAKSLGHWSGFSELSSKVTPSMKYTLPLIAEDGTVYGVIGVGLTEGEVLSNIPAYDFLSETACYVLGYTTSDNTFDVMTYSGSAYSTLLGSENTIHVSDRKEDEGVYSIDMVTDVELSGSVQYMEMYDDDSIYADERWALISVASTSSVLRPLRFLQQMLLLSALLSMIVAALVAIPSCSKVIRPISNASKLMKTKRKHNEVVRFQPSNIYEIDEMTDAITQLQIDVQATSSRVSKIISVADVGLGTFMYNRKDDSIFLGQSLIKILKLDMPRGEDVVMGLQEFLDSVVNPELRSMMQENLQIGDNETPEDHSKEYEINKIGGGTLWLRLSCIYFPDNVMGIVQDITDTMMEKKRIEYERDYDALTGLLNRHAYYRQVERLFGDKSRLGVTAFIMIDLDNLKYVNDTYGHDFGDDYIKAAATALKKYESYGSIVSRISGDEFNICLPGFPSKKEAGKVIADMRAELLQSSCLLPDGTHFKVGASMGVSWYPDDADSYELLMKYADFAMYTIKNSTKGEIAEFNINAYSTDSVLLTGVEEMNRIIGEGRVKYAFQSIVSAKTGEIYGYEALMRVQSDIFQSPLELLRTAKTGAKLYEIERLTWTKSLADFQTQLEAGHVEEKAHIFINSIANNTLDAEVLDEIEKKYPHLLPKIVVEIVESERSSEECTTHKTQVIRKWGGQLALDDFGTGYNNEYALLNLQPNIIKIDRSIINGCDKDASRQMIINSLVKLAQSKGILVLAEGVETEKEMNTVISCGVDLLQGYYLTYPLFEPEPIDAEITNTIKCMAKSRDKNGLS